MARNGAEGKDFLRCASIAIARHLLQVKGNFQMKTILLLGSILLLSAVGAVAQYGGDSDSASKTTSSKMAVEGCLDGAVGRYTLTDFAGVSYQLTGNTEQLKSHVGETVLAKGEITPVVHLPGAMSEGTEAQPTLSVISLRRLSAVCVRGLAVP
jgi:hypothetical protein